MGYESVRAKIEGIIKIGVLSKKTKIYAHKQSDELLILGNGPSLKTDMEKLNSLKTNRDVLSVNYFPVTNEFLDFKPQYHVITSSMYWKKAESKNWDKDRNKVFQNLVEKVTWELHLFVPMIARSSNRWRDFMAKNPNIKINFINLTPIDTDPAFFKRFLERFKACPRPHNVLVPSILIGINLNYKRCYLAGADHSWIPEIFVTNDNMVMVAQKHFYADQFKGINSTLLTDKAKPMFNEDGSGGKKLHEILYKFYCSFKSYWLLKEYAELKGTQIFNLTEGSYIDAFDKISFDDISG
ncbi:MAG: hypothetical protein NXI10_03960 [bacterium]|nr:hypothetical protein [bacterium]